MWGGGFKSAHNGEYGCGDLGLNLRISVVNLALSMYKMKHKFDHKNRVFDAGFVKLRTHLH